MRNISLTPELLGKARRLKESNYFVNPSDGAELVDKQLIFLVLVGLKPVAETPSGHWVESPTGRQTVADDPQEVADFLNSLGLRYHLSDRDGHATMAVVSLQQNLVDEYVNATSQSEVGRLFGYPQTAIDAFANGEDSRLPFDKQDTIERQYNLPLGLLGFRLSRDHWKEEMEVVKSWQAVLKEAGLSE